MADIMDITELDFNDNNFSSNSGFSKLTNFGGGLELLMNDKVKDKKKLASDIDL